MTLKFLLDTTIVSAPIAKEPNRRVVKKLEQHGAHCAIAAPVWHELIYGASRLPAGKRRTALEEYLHHVVRSSFPVLAYDEAAAEWHGKERARLEDEGRTPPFVDGQIAAIASTQSLVLVTSNTKDFRAFAGVETMDWAT
ncbi:MAG TPA: type II toxin-antitoxin system VapC family toxin [Polyangia bacterium]|nr:type II toxin-antitoxin system VapC family toxin [Polyangia bacterium]